ncbi:hypothetical protein E6O75_ATG05427 [Venturia nashicola]|uniref:Uncharacterized protein n=1 Tax=Venturia nashicola TaxID=86259 RepID=A0A4Z1NWZ5_9PEZI|nr:hypothetical protein E6O75_ATG05427 [Venturia nashicola]
MRISIALTASLLACIASISGEKHKYCCCSNKKDGCLTDETKAVMKDHKTGGVWQISPYSYYFYQGATFECDNCYLIAIKNDLTGAKAEDGFIGGEQMSNECAKQHAGSSCWDPKPNTGA